MPSIHASRPWSRKASLLAVLAVCGAAAPAQAIPVLQLYLEGAQYDTGSESWVASPSGSSGGAPFRLWAIANTGAVGTVFDAMLTFSWDASLGDLAIIVKESTTGGYRNFDDPSIANAADPQSIVRDGSVPLDGNNKPLSSGGLYGSGRYYQTFKIGDLSGVDSPLVDFDQSFTGPVADDAPLRASISVYEISVLKIDGTSAHGATVSIDFYDHYISKNRAKYVEVPGSHDAKAVQVEVVPAPAAAFAVAPVLFGLGLWCTRRNRLAPDVPHS